MIIPNIFVQQTKKFFYKVVDKGKKTLYYNKRQQGGIPKSG